MTRAGSRGLKAKNKRLRTEESKGGRVSLNLMPYAPARKPNRKKYKRRLSGFHTLVIMILLAIVTSASISAFEKLQGVLLNSSIFALKGVSIQGNHRISSADILDALDLTSGTDSIYSIMSHIVEKRIKARFRYLEQVEIERKANGWMTIMIEEKEPVALIADSRDADCFDICDAHGSILEEEVRPSHAGMPVIIRPVTGDDASRAIILALDVLAHSRSVIPELCSEISCIDTRDPDNIILTLDPGYPLVKPGMLNAGYSEPASSIQHPVSRNVIVRIASDRIREGLSDILPIVIRRREESKETKYIDARFPGAVYCRDAG
jgi:cell division septal protein FtsQ